MDGGDGELDGTMLGFSATYHDPAIEKILLRLQPKSILEYGSGQGKLGAICKKLGLNYEALDGVQVTFSPEDQDQLLGRGYTNVINQDVLEFVRDGMCKKYDLIAALDVLEHFMFSDAISIVDCSLHYCDFFLMVWPSKNPQNLNNKYDIHRSSIELNDLSNRFDVVYYSQTNLIEYSFVQRFHIALIRGHMNVLSLRPPIC